MEPNNLFFGVRAIIFDLDGTLVLTERLKFEAYRLAARQWHKELRYDSYKNLIGKSRRAAAEQLVAQLGLQIPWPEFAAARDVEHQALVAAARIPMIRPAVKFLKAIPRPQYHVSLVSGSSMDRMEWILKGTRLGDHFDSIVSGENLPHKPEPDLYVAAIELASVTPWECVVIEDSESGIVGAVRAGVRALAVPNNATRDQDFSRAHLRVDSLEHLIPFL